MADRYLFQIFERDKDYLTPIIERLGLHKKYMKIFEEHSISFDVFRVLKEDHLEQMGMFCSSKLFLQVSLRATFLFIEISLLSLCASHVDSMQTGIESFGAKRRILRAIKVPFFELQACYQVCVCGLARGTFTQMRHFGYIYVF